MPELPEVETIVRQLQNTLQGKTIESMEIFDKKSFNRKRNFNRNGKVFPLKSIQKLTSAKIIKVERRAKAILFGLEGKKYLFIRLGMTGHFSYAEEREQRKKKYAVAAFHFSDGTSLTFHDIRKFGSLQLISEQKLRQELRRIGPEPLDKQFTSSLLLQLLQKKKNANLKTTLMDQSVIAGIGNIYAQEALYHARINPQRTAGSLTLQEAKKLYIRLQSILRKAIAAGGSTVDNYSSLEGAGSFQQHLAVYQQERCPQKHLLQRIVLGGRGTWWCKACQR